MGNSVRRAQSREVPRSAGPRRTDARHGTSFGHRAPFPGAARALRCARSRTLSECCKHAKGAGSAGRPRAHSRDRHQPRRPRASAVMGLPTVQPKLKRPLGQSGKVRNTREKAPRKRSSPGRVSGPSIVAVQRGTGHVRAQRPDLAKRTCRALPKCQTSKRSPISRLRRSAAGR